MRSFFTITSGNHEYHQMAKVLVTTAHLNSNLDLHCIYDGQPDEFTDWLARRNVPVLFWQVPFLNKINQYYTGKKPIEHCRGAYLCLEIPNVVNEYGFDDEFVLYIDVDTMILNDIHLENIRPKLASAAPCWKIDDWTYLNAGVMVFNVHNLREVYEDFIEHIVKHNFDFEFTGLGPCSQGAWNSFLAGELEKLLPEYNWKPFWGYNENAKIIHFSGPNPNEAALFLSDSIKVNTETYWQKIHRYAFNQDRNSYDKYIRIWNEYAESALTPK